MKKIIFLEFNELCPSLLKKWMAEGQLPHFKKFFEQSEVFTSLADAEAPNLEPWIQWYSMHTGLSFDQHGVFRLTDGPEKDYKDVWGILNQNGVTASSCSSMNVNGFDYPGAFYVPDPWCKTEKPTPQELNVFHSFIAENVQEYSNQDKGNKLGRAANFVYFLIRKGLSIKTISKILFTLMEEKLISKDAYWKRVFILDWMVFDVYRHYLKKTKPAFSTLFLNSTAHLQHSYWRYMEPEKFHVQPNDNKYPIFKDAIFNGYQNMDMIIKHLLDLEKSGEFMLALSSALSQQPFLRYEEKGGQHFYRPRKVEKLLSDLNINTEKCLPVMTHQYMLKFKDAKDYDHAFETLSKVKLEDKNVFMLQKHDKRSLYIGCQISTELPQDTMLEIGGNKRKVPFFDVFYKIDEIKSGCHHPDGVLWFKTGQFKEHKDKVSILNVLPTLTKYYGVPLKEDKNHKYFGEALDIKSLY